MVITGIEVLEFRDTKDTKDILSLIEPISFKVTGNRVACVESNTDLV
jgi:hypothetical protein